MSVTLLPNSNALPEAINSSERQIVVYLAVTLTGNYGIANGHGDLLPFGGLPLINSNQPPTDCFVYEEPTAGNAPTGYSFIFARGVDINTCKLIVLQNAGAGNPGSELTQGAAYPAALLAATANIKLVAEFPFSI